MGIFRRSGPSATPTQASIDRQAAWQAAKAQPANADTPGNLRDLAENLALAALADGDSGEAGFWTQLAALYAVTAPPRG